MQTANPELLKTALASHQIHAAPAGSDVAIAREMMRLPLSEVIEPDLYRVCVTESAKILGAIRPADRAQSFDFRIGDRTYHVARDDRRGNGWSIVSNGDLVEYVSSKHYGDADAFLRIARRISDIETAWSALQIAQGK